MTTMIANLSASFRYKRACRFRAYNCSAASVGNCMPIVVLWAPLVAKSQYYLSSIIRSFLGRENSLLSSGLFRPSQSSRMVTSAMYMLQVLRNDLSPYLTDRNWSFDVSKERYVCWVPAGLHQASRPLRPVRGAGM